MEQENKPEEAITDENSQEQHEEYGPPTGAVTFAAIMLVAYIAYYLFIWFEVFVIRGA